MNRDHWHCEPVVGGGGGAGEIGEPNPAPGTALLQAPVGAVSVTDHVLLRRSAYDALVKLETRAKAKLVQLKAEARDDARAEHIRVLTWLLDEGLP